MKQKNKILNIFVYGMIFVLMILSVSAAQTAVNLGTASNFVLLAKSGISTTGSTSIVGDIGVSPIDSTGITGFGLIMDASNQFSTSSLVNGHIYAADYTPPTPAVMTTAISDMEIAYTDAAGRTLPDYTELGAGDIGGMTLKPGLYKWSTGVIIPTDVTLSGSSTDVWIFQIAQTLDISNGKQVILSGGAQAKNIFWQVADQATLGTTAVFNGNILGQTAIVLNTGAVLNGRALAQTAVTLDANTVLTAGKNTAAVIEKVVIQNKTAVKNNTIIDNDTMINDSVINWQCTEWSLCNSEGIQKKTCTKPNSQVTTTQNQNCIAQINKTKIVIIRANDTTDTIKNKDEVKVEKKVEDDLNKNNNEQKDTSKKNEIVTPIKKELTAWDNFVHWIRNLFN